MCSLARAATAVSAAVAALLGSFVVLAPAASAAACSDVDVVFARGTGEPAGPGSVGRPFIQQLTSALSGRSVSSYAVNYPASFDQNAGPGTTDLTQHVRSTASQCPNTTFVLGGYSQGATVVNGALGIRTGFSSGQALPADLAPRIAAVVVYGNPLNSSGRTIAREAPTYAAKAKEFCNRQDSVCGGRGTTSGSHTSYQSNGTIPDGARFAAGLVGAPAA